MIGSWMMDDGLVHVNGSRKLLEIEISPIVPIISQDGSSFAGIVLIARSIVSWVSCCNNVTLRPFRFLCLFSHKCVCALTDSLQI